jgi:glycosyltransferase involved in cell wall biosynthesis
MKILQLTVHYEPNVGGVETHLHDLVSGLIKRSHNVFVLTYRPLVSKAAFNRFEQAPNYTVFRIPWIRGLFYKFKGPLQFLYTFPGLFFATPFAILLFNPDVVHAHGIVAGFVGVFWAKAFNKRVVVSTHSLYEFPKSGMYRNFVTGIFQRADEVLTLSKQSKEEVASLGIDRNKIIVFTYWIDLEKFRFMNNDLRFKNRKRLGWGKNFIILFVGRLVPEKGIPELLKAAELLNKNVTIAIAGSGPMEETIKNQELRIKNIKFLGKVDQDKLPEYYSAADMVIVPSTHEEGFGRVIIESLACSTPVIGSNRGAIPEAMDKTVGELITVTPENIAKTIEYYLKDPKELMQKSKNARKFAEKRYGEKNIEQIIKAYK